MAGIELLGLAAEPVPHERINYRLKPLNLCVSLALGDHHIGQLAGLLEGERTERFDVFWQVRFHEHGSSESAGGTPVNRQSAGQSGGVRHAPGASPDLRVRRPIAPPSTASHRLGCPAT